MRARLILAGAALAAVASAIVVLRPTTERPRADPAARPAPDRPRTLTLEARAGSTTEVDYTHAGPPPWPTGNCFDLSTDRRRLDAPAYRVVNMHAENFGRVVDLLRLATVEVLVLDDRRCLVTDPRIPREWLLATPCRVCTPPDLRERLRASHADRFRGG